MVGAKARLKIVEPIKHIKHGGRIRHCNYQLNIMRFNGLLLGGVGWNIVCGGIFIHSAFLGARLQILVAVPVAYGSEPGMRPKVSAERSQLQSVFLQIEGNSTEIFLILALL
jgi:hypothetical protein